MVEARGASAASAARHRHPLDLVALGDLRCQPLMAEQEGLLAYRAPVG